MKKHPSYAVQQGVELKKRENVKMFHVKHYNEKTKTLKGFTMKLQKATEYASLDLLDAFTAVPVEGGYLLALDHRGETRQGTVLETAQGKEKLYSTLDSLNNDVERITGGQRQPWTMKI